MYIQRHQYWGREGQKISALVDTGSAVNLIRSHSYVKIGAPQLEIDKIVSMVQDRAKPKL